MRVQMLIGLSLTLAISPAVAQVRPSGATSAADSQDNEPIVQQRQQTSLETNPSGRTARSSVGQLGYRQTRDAAAQQAGIKPMARIANRVQNRVQNRIRNRIDRDYNPQANATNPFAVAEDQARKSGRPR